MRKGTTYIDPQEIEKHKHGRALLMRSASAKGIRPTATYGDRDGYVGHVAEVVYDDIVSEPSNDSVAGSDLSSTSSRPEYYSERCAVPRCVEPRELRAKIDIEEYSFFVEPEVLSEGATHGSVCEVSVKQSDPKKISDWQKYIQEDLVPIFQLPGRAKPHQDTSKISKIPQPKIDKDVFQPPSSVQWDELKSMPFYQRHNLFSGRTSFEPEDFLEGGDGYGPGGDFYAEGYAGDSREEQPTAQAAARRKLPLRLLHKSLSAH